MISIDDALKTVLEDLPLLEAESVPIVEALGRSLAENIVSRDTVPHDDNSAMDGIVARGWDVTLAAKDKPVRLRILGTILAGDRPDLEVGDGCCAKIMTGAAIPPGGDAVIPQEKLYYDGDYAVVSMPVAQGEHIRHAGEDIKAGQRVFEAGEEISSAHIGVLASIGVKQVKVVKKPRVVIVATGSELIGPDQEIEVGRVRNSNGPGLEAAVLAAGGTPKNFGIVRDDLKVLSWSLAKAIDEADVVITSGGVSVGEHDFVQEAMIRNGVEVLFDKVAQKPGKPMSFGRRKDKRFFGLPGNPSAALVCFEVYVRALLRGMQGFSRIFHPHAYGRFQEPVNTKGDRGHLLRVIATPNDEGFRLRLSGKQGSGLLLPMTRGRCIAYVPAEKQWLTPLDVIKFWMLN